MTRAGFANCGLIMGFQVDCYDYNWNFDSVFSVSRMHTNAKCAYDVKQQTRTAGAAEVNDRAVTAVLPCSHTKFGSVHACIPGLC